MTNSADNLLITGGAGFLGSHMVASCLEKDIQVTVLDNLANSDCSNLKALEIYFNKRILFFNIDLRDSKALKDFFDQNEFSAVIHFAGLKSVSESIQNPSLYYDNNVLGSKNLIECVKAKRIKKIIFSSSATVYGKPSYLPIDEMHPRQPTNPYGESKVQVEDLFLRDDYFSKEASATILRYFNPIGSYRGIIEEKPRGIPNNLMPYILGVARGEFPYVNVYGDDYDTPDGTGVRDYIHVMDLIDAHQESLKNQAPGCYIYNVGCGQGYSVNEVIKTFEQVHKVSIPSKIKPRRPGDVAASFAKVEHIKQDINWFAKRSLAEMCKDAWFGKANVYET